MTPARQDDSGARLRSGSTSPGGAAAEGEERPGGTTTDPARSQEEVEHRPPIVHPGPQGTGPGCGEHGPTEPDDDDQQQHVRQRRPTAHPDDNSAEHRRRSPASKIRPSIVVVARSATRPRMRGHIRPGVDAAPPRAPARRHRDIPSHAVDVAGENAAVAAIRRVPGGQAPRHNSSAGSQRP